MKGKLIVGSALAGILAGAFANADTHVHRELLVSGPVEEINLTAGTLTVLSRNISSADVYRVVPGELVNVYGTMLDDGSIKDAVLEAVATYIPGADSVFVKGIVTTSDVAVGQLRIGGILIDYTAMLGSNNYKTPAVGDLVELSGTQPQLGGVILAVSGAQGRTAGISGSGNRTAGISGSGNRTAGISGSGNRTAGISGSGNRTAGISGSGNRTAGISGSGNRTAGISGSGNRTAGG